MYNLILILILFLVKSVNSYNCDSYTNEMDCINHSDESCVWCMNDDNCYNTNPCTLEQSDSNCSDIIIGNYYLSCQKYLQVDFVLLVIMNLLISFSSIICGRTCFCYYWSQDTTKDKTLYGIFGALYILLPTIYILTSLMMLIIFYTTANNYLAFIITEILLIINTLTILFLFIIFISIHIIRYLMDKKSNNII